MKIKNKKTQKNPPKIAVWFLNLISIRENKNSLVGDVEEEYEEIRLEKGTIIAHLWLWWQFLITIPSFIKHKIYWSYIMLKNYFKIALRNLTKHKFYSFIKLW